MTDSIRIPLCTVTAGALILLMHSLDFHWRIAPTIKPEPKAKAAEMSAPQCRLVKNGRKFTGEWIFLQNESGQISGACLYEKKGRSL